MIESVRIKNYISCKDVNVLLNNPVTALIGKNAAGKTNILKGLFFASQCWFHFADEEKKSYLTKDFSAEFKINLQVDEVTEQFVYKYKVCGEKKEYIKDSLWTVKGDKEINIFQKKTKDRINLNTENEAKEIPIPPDMTGLRYIPSLASSNDEVNSNVSHLIMRISLELFRTIYYTDEEAKSIEFILKSAFEEWSDTDKYKENNQLFTFQYYDFFINRRKSFDEYKEILKALGLIQDVENIEYKSQPADENESDSVIFFLFHVNGKKIPFNALSDGTKRIIRLLFYYLYKEESLWLIEEPENSIHYGLLAALVNVLDQYADSKKVLFSTHSEQILNQLKPEQLIYLNNIIGETEAKYLTGKSLEKAKAFLTDIGSTGEYVTSGGLEGDIND